jgi:hypothetical protein
LTVLFCSTGMRCALAQASWRIPVTCQETLILGLPPAILNWLRPIGFAMWRFGAGTPIAVKLVAKIPVESLKPTREGDDRSSIAVKHDRAIINVFHIRRFYG